MSFVRFAYQLFVSMAIGFVGIAWLGLKGNSPADKQLLAVSVIAAVLAIILKVILVRKSLSSDKLRMILTDVGFDNLVVSRLFLSARGRRPDGTYVYGGYNWGNLRGRISPKWGLAGDTNMTFYIPVSVPKLLFHVCRVTDHGWDIQPLLGMVDFVHLEDGTAWLKENLPGANSLRKEFVFKIQFAKKFTAIMYGPRSPADPGEIERNIRDAASVVDHLINTSTHSTVDVRGNKDESLSRTLRILDGALGRR